MKSNHPLETEKSDRPFILNVCLEAHAPEIFKSADKSLENFEQRITPFIDDILKRTEHQGKTATNIVLCQTALDRQFKSADFIMSKRRANGSFIYALHHMKKMLEKRCKIPVIIEDFMLEDIFTSQTKFSSQPTMVKITSTIGDMKEDAKEIPSYPSINPSPLCRFTDKYEEEYFLKNSLRNNKSLIYYPLHQKLREDYKNHDIRSVIYENDSLKKADITSTDFFPSDCEVDFCKLTKQIHTVKTGKCLDDANYSATTIALAQLTNTVPVGQFGDKKVDSSKVQTILAGRSDTTDSKKILESKTTLLTIYIKLFESQIELVEIARRLSQELKSTQELAGSNLDSLLDIAKKTYDIATFPFTSDRQPFQLLDIPIPLIPLQQKMALTDPKDIILAATIPDLKTSSLPDCKRLLLEEIKKIASTYPKEATAQLNILLDFFLKIRSAQQKSLARTVKNFLYLNITLDKTLLSPITKLYGKLIPYLPPAQEVYVTERIQFDYILAYRDFIDNKKRPPLSSNLEQLLKTALQHFFNYLGRYDYIGTSYQNDVKQKELFQTMTALLKTLATSETSEQALLIVKTQLPSILEKTEETDFSMRGGVPVSYAYPLPAGRDLLDAIEQSELTYTAFDRIDAELFYAIPLPTDAHPIPVPLYDEQRREPLYNFTLHLEAHHLEYNSKKIKFEEKENSLFIADEKLLEKVKSMIKDGKDRLSTIMDQSIINSIEQCLAFDPSDQKHNRVKVPQEQSWMSFFMLKPAPERPAEKFERMRQYIFRAELLSHVFKACMDSKLTDSACLDKIVEDLRSMKIDPMHTKLHHLHKELLNKMISRQCLLQQSQPSLETITVIGDSDPDLETTITVIGDSDPDYAVTGPTIRKRAGK